MRALKKTAIATIAAASTLFFVSGGASARVICNEDGDCWHATTTYDYPADAHVTFHEDAWKWGDKDHFRWHEHEGRGYWHGHTWATF